MNSPCQMCPCKPTTPELHRHIVRSRIEEIKASGGLPCHEKHPDAHVLLDSSLENGKYRTKDCAGYKLWGLTK